MRSPVSAAPWPAVWRLLAAALPAVVAGCDIRDEVIEPARASADRLLRAEALAAGGFFAPGAGGPATGRESIEFVEGYEAARSRAETERKPLLVVCLASWCRWSCDFTQGVLTEPQIVALSRRYVCVTLDADRHADACKTLRVAAFPTVIVLGADGTERTRTVGRPTPSTLAATMETGLRATVAGAFR